MDLLKADYNTKISEIESKIPSVSGLATNSSLTTVENKIPDVSNLVKKTDYNTKINEIKKKVTHHNHDKYITTLEFNNLKAKSLAARLVQANSINKTCFHTKLISLNKKINSSKTKYALVENELKNCKHLIQDIFESKMILKTERKIV